MGEDQILLDLVLIIFGYFIAIFSRFRIFIGILHLLIGIIRGYQWFTKNRVQIDEKIAAWIRDIKKAEAMIFPVIFRPFRRKRKSPNPVFGSLTDTKETTV